MGAWGEEHGDGSIGMGSWGWEHRDGSVEMGLCIDGIMGMRSWGWERGDGRMGMRPFSGILFSDNLYFFDQMISFLQ